MKKKSNSQHKPVGRSPSVLRVRKVAGEDAWEFVHPRCAIDRADDIDEVRKMIAADELDIAIDEVRWLLNGCSDFVEAHKALGELALLDQDFPLARGHFGYAFDIGVKAMKSAGCRGLLPYRIEANQAFHEAGKGLAFALKRLDKPQMLRRTVETLLQCDPSDPLGVKGFLNPEQAPPLNG